MQDAASSRYSAFISYNHRDARHARRLQQRIESYRLPRHLESPAAADRRLKPVFRDRSELTAAADLTASVREAIAASDYLIVICTANSAKSEWVGREIALFRSLRGDHAILAALFEGESSLAFHPELLSQAADGSPIRPLAADFRSGGDGERLALLKLVAVLAGVRLDALVQRDAQRRLRQAAAIGIGAAIILVLIGVFVTLAVTARAQARREQARGVAAVARLVDQREQFSKAGRLDLLAAHDRAALDFFHGQNIASLPPQAQLLSAKLLQGISEDDDDAGDLAGLKDASGAAWRTTARLLAARPNDPDRILAHAHSEYWVGYAAWRLGDMAAAERHFIAYAKLANRLVTIDPGRAEWQREAADADSNLGALILRRSADLDRAGRLFRAAQARFEAASRVGPYDRDVQIDLADGYAWLADIERLKRDYAAALAYRGSQRRTLETMQSRDPDDAEMESGLIKNRLGLARIAAAQGRWRDAISGFESGREMARARAREDRTNDDIARQIRGFDLFEVRTWLDMPKSLRPPTERIAAVLGDCAAERAKPHNEEAAVFCTILEARLTADKGDTAGAAKHLDGIESMIGQQGRITQRWRLRLLDELNQIR